MSPCLPWLANGINCGLHLLGVKHPILRYQGPHLQIRLELAKALKVIRPVYVTTKVQRAGTTTAAPSETPRTETRFTAHNSTMFVMLLGTVCGRLGTACDTF